MNTIDTVGNPFLNPINQENQKPNYMAVMQNEWYIYGNSTHGRFARAFPYVSAQVNEGGYDNALHPEKLYQSRRLRLKEYELKDHLGNVRAVVSDFKNKADTMTTNPPFNAEVLAVYNYYPFGMLQPGMYAENNAQRTRFGFNGMLRDDDVKDKLTTTTIDEGRGNSYATHYRLYDPRVTRWFSVDPLVAQFPWTSPYTGMGNNPVSRIDPMGDADYEINNRGELINRIENKENDSFYILNDENKRDDTRTISFEYGTIEKVRKPTIRIKPTKEIEHKSITLFDVKGDKNATDLFEFFADPKNTSVEWSLARIGGEKSGKNIVGTAHESYYTPVGQYLRVTGYTLKEVIHNHPSGNAYPSRSDIHGAKLYHQSNTNTVLKIYTHPNNYFEYKYQDIFKYPEITVTPDD